MNRLAQHRTALTVAAAALLAVVSFGCSSGNSADQTNTTAGRSAGAPSAAGPLGSSPAATSGTAGGSTPGGTASGAGDPTSTTAPAGPTAAPGPTPPGPTVTFPTSTTNPIQVRTSNTSGVRSGDTITIHAEAPPGSKLYGVKVRLCAGDAEIAYDADLNPTQTGLCVLHPLAPGTDTLKDLPVGPPNQSIDVTFKVGAGVDSYNRQDGTPVNIRCDAAHPCQLAVKLQFPGGFGFKTYRLEYA